MEQAGFPGACTFREITTVWGLGRVPQVSGRGGFRQSEMHIQLVVR